MEDETDVQAAKVVDAEQKAELAEFDENIPWDEKEEASRREEEDCSKVEQELSMLEKEVRAALMVGNLLMLAQMMPKSNVIWLHSRCSYLITIGPNELLAAAPAQGIKSLGWN